MTLVIVLEPLSHGLPPCFCVKGSNTGSCNCQQCAIVLGRTRGEVAFCSANGTCIVHSSVLERTWLGQRQHQVMLGVGKPWGPLLCRVHWNKQAELPVGFAAPHGQHILERIPGMCTAAVALAVQESQ